MNNRLMYAILFVVTMQSALILYLNFFAPSNVSIRRIENTDGKMILLDFYNKDTDRRACRVDVLYNNEYLEFNDNWFDPLEENEEEIKKIPECESNNISNRTIA